MASSAERHVESIPERGAFLLEPFIGLANAWEPPCIGDQTAIAAQLGRSPHPVLAVAARCAGGHPCVIVNCPVARCNQVGRESRLVVFPTLFWLTCPTLRRAVGRLEAAGWIARFDSRLAVGAWREEMRHAHATYAALRSRLALATGLWPEHPNLVRVLVETGIGGAAWPAPRSAGAAGLTGVEGEEDGLPGVKCLHAHLADYLARGDVNPVGWAVALLLEHRAELRDSGCCPIDASRQRTYNGPVSGRSGGTADAGDLKSSASTRRVGSNPTSGTTLS